MKGVDCMIYTKEIDIMQHNIVHIRKSLGMNGEQFGALIGFTRQTINNIEKRRTGLTLSNYYAILYVLEKQIYPNCSEFQRKTIERLLVDKVEQIEYAQSLIFEEGV